MAEQRTRPVSRVKPATVFSTVAVGAVTASMTMAGAIPAHADDFPSWGDIEQAKQNEQTKQAEIDKVGQLLQSLQQQADAAVQASQVAAEAYRNAIIARDAAAQREEELKQQAEKAQAVAQISKMRAGLIASHLAKTAGNDLGTELMFSGDDAAGLLQQLGLASKLGEQSTAVYAQALSDRNAADSLRAQASEASKERQRLAADAQAKAADAQAKADAANAAVASQEQHSTELYAQLASLRNTTAELERERADGIARQRAAEALAAAQAAAAAAAAAKAAQQAQQNNGGDGSGGGSAPAGGGSAGSNPSPPNQGAVETAIWFAQQQLGKPYELGGMGPDTWDCSGLTKASYAAAGVYIGSHSATNQYYTLAGQGKAVSLDSIQRGDLLFWGWPGDYYHVAIYLGGGQIIEAADYGKPVRIYYIWGSPSAAARPTG